MELPRQIAKKLGLGLRHCASCPERPETPGQKVIQKPHFKPPNAVLTANGPVRTPRLIQKLQFLAHLQNHHKIDDLQKGKDWYQVIPWFSPPFSAAFSAAFQRGFREQCGMCAFNSRAPNGFPHLGQGLRTFFRPPRRPRSRFASDRTKAGLSE